MIKSICVFAGSSLGSISAYSSMATQLGKGIVSSGYSMVYGGGSKGLMGVIADSVIESGGEVRGVITQQLKEIEVAHKGLTELFVVSTMHERKALMAKLSEAIIALPGGVGTWEEFYEALAWNQLGLHSKPIILVNVEDYYSGLYKFTEKAVEEGFLPSSTFEDLYIVHSPKEAINIVENFKEKDKDKWFERMEE